MSNLTDAPGGTNSPLQKLELALHQASASGKSKLERDFKQAYPVFEQHIARKVRKKLLMDHFNDAYKHQLNLAQFRKLLNAERSRRKADGDEVACTSCGQLLCSAVDAASTNSTTEGA
jgi:hypothetical protein